MFEETPEEKRARVQKAIEFAGKYARSFEPELLEHWYKAIVEHSQPPNASHAELAADNALRAFVVGIIRQVNLAKYGDVNASWNRNLYSTPPPPSQGTPEPSSQPAKKKRGRPRKNPQ